MTEWVGVEGACAGASAHLGEDHVPAYSYVPKSILLGGKSCFHFQPTFPKLQSCVPRDLVCVSLRRGVP